MILHCIDRYTVYRARSQGKTIVGRMGEDHHRVKIGIARQHSAGLRYAIFVCIHGMHLYPLFLQATGQLENIGNVTIDEGNPACAAF